MLKKWLKSFEELEKAELAWRDSRLTVGSINISIMVDRIEEKCLKFIVESGKLGEKNTIYFQCKEQELRDLYEALGMLFKEEEIKNVK